MNVFSKIIFGILLYSVSFYAQETEKNSIQYSDSSNRFQGLIPPVEYQYDLNQFFTDPLFNELPEELLFENNSSNIWLRTELLISNNSQSEFGEVNTFFTAPLYQQYLKDSEFDMVRYVLGTIQTGAVAYMAYRHIKKYGFWK